MSEPSVNESLNQLVELVESLDGLKDRPASKDDVAKIYIAMIRLVDFTTDVMRLNISGNSLEVHEDLRKSIGATIESIGNGLSKSLTETSKEDDGN